MHAERLAGTALQVAPCARTLRPIMEEQKSSIMPGRLVNGIFF